MRPFFWPTQSNRVQARKRAPGLSCSQCSLRKGRGDKITSWGEGGRGILIVGAGPLENDVKMGRLWSSAWGMSFQRLLKRRHGIDLYKDCLSISAVCCPLPGTNPPSHQDIQCCYTNLWDKILEVKPRLILLMGMESVSSFLLGRWKKDLGGIMKWHGWHIPDQEVGAWACPIFHPMYVDERKRTEAFPLVFRQEIESALTCLDKPFPDHTGMDSRVRVLLSPKDIVGELARILKRKPLIAFDYETTGLKPHKEGHQIVCASIATSSRKAIAFPLDDPRVRRLFTRVLKDPDIRKMAHNMKFEQAWSMVRLKTEVAGWEWDSMLASHILDNRGGISSLKFQTYVRFGIVDYDSVLGTCLQGVVKKDANSMNRVLNFIQSPGGRHALLQYCGLDSLFEYKLARLQRDLIYG